MMKINNKGLSGPLVTIVLAIFLILFGSSMYGNVFGSASNSFDKAMLLTCDADNDGLKGNEDICPCNPKRPRGNGYVKFTQEFIENLPDDEDASLYVQFLDYSQLDTIKENKVFWEEDVEIILAYVQASNEQNEPAEPFQDKLSPRAQAVLVKNRADGSTRNRILDADVFCPNTIEWSECTPEKVMNYWFAQRITDDTSKWDITCERECTEDYVEEQCNN